MSPFRTLAVLLPLAMLCHTGLSQVFRKENLVVNLNGKTFDKALPYDEPFNISGDVGKLKNTSVIGFSYELANKDKTWLVPDKWKSGSTMVAVNPDSTTFSFECPGIVPNRDYNFRFILYSSFADVAKKTALKKIIADAWMTFYDDGNGN